MGFADLVEELALIEDAGIRQKVAAVWDAALSEHNINAEELHKLPFCDEVPVGRVSLLTHLRAVARTAAHLADIYTDTYGVAVDKDALVAAALLHDVGKLDERKNALLEHSLSSVLRAAREGLPDKVLHAIAFHSESAAAKRRCAEAELLYFADFAHYRPLLECGNG